MDADDSVRVEGMRSSPKSRRDFMGKVGVATAASIAGGVLLTSPSESQALTPTGDAILNFSDIRRHENAHVPAVQNAIRAAGGTPRPRPVFRNLRQPDYDTFVRIAKAFENVGVGAYLGALPNIQSQTVVAASGSIALIEARHASWLNLYTPSNVRRITANVFNNEQSFERPLTRLQVIDRISPFLANLNGGPAIFYGEYKSSTNDINILNFALALEFLEQDFYNINVPRFFPGT